MQRGGSTIGCSPLLSIQPLLPEAAAHLELVQRQQRLQRSVARRRQRRRRQQRQRPQRRQPLRQARDAERGAVRAPAPPAGRRRGDLRSWVQAAEAQGRDARQRAQRAQHVGFEKDQPAAGGLAAATLAVRREVAERCEVRDAGEAARVGGAVAGGGGEGLDQQAAAGVQVGQRQRRQGAQAEARDLLSRGPSGISASLRLLCVGNGRRVGRPGSATMDQIMPACAFPASQHSNTQ